MLESITDLNPITIHVMMRKWFCLLVLIVSSCGSPAPSLIPIAPQNLQTLSTLKPGGIFPPTTGDFSKPNTPIIEFAPTIEPTSTPESAIPLKICSPLQDVPLLDIESYVVNPYLPPRAGSDDPHQGVDFAILQPGTNIALAGPIVEIVLAGEVAGVIQDRFPFGNAVLIETPLKYLDLSKVHLPDLEITPEPNPSLTCPAIDENMTRSGSQSLKGSELSLYLLYAHLQNTPEVVLDEQVTCGDSLGVIGDSGNALNPHLHLEARIGPSGARFPSLAHYDASATPGEMALYCLWRVNGLFQTLDPMEVLHP